MMWARSAGIGRDIVCLLHGVRLDERYHRHRGFNALELTPDWREVGGGHNQNFTKNWYVATNMGFGPGSV
jgi:hypothetical protein